MKNVQRRRCVRRHRPDAFFIGDQASSGSGSSTAATSAASRSRRRAPAPRFAASTSSTSAFCARCRSAWSISTIASIASAIGVARMPTHGIVAAVRVDDDRSPGLVDRVAVEPDRRRRLDRDRHDDVLAGRDAAQDAARVVATGSPAASSRRNARCLAARRREAGADLDALHGVDAHHRVRRDRHRACRRPARPSRPARRSRSTVMRAPQESPDLRSRSMNASSSGDDRRVGDEERIGVDVREVLERNRRADRSASGGRGSRTP